MKQVAKLLMIDDQDKYLLMYRSEHPLYGQDADLPGGTLEGDESLLEGMLREVQEEAGVDIDPATVKEVYTGTDYSAHNTQFTLFVAHLAKRPAITMSWEHSKYEWIGRDDFLQKAKNAKDSYMHMVHDVLLK